MLELIRIVKDFPNDLVSLYFLVNSVDDRALIKKIKALYKHNTLLPKRQVIEYLEELLKER